MSRFDIEEALRKAEEAARSNIPPDYTDRAYERDAKDFIDRSKSSHMLAIMVTGAICIGTAYVAAKMIPQLDDFGLQQRIEDASGINDHNRTTISFYPTGQGIEIHYEGIYQNKTINKHIATVKTKPQRFWIEDNDKDGTSDFMMEWYDKNQEEKERKEVINDFLNSVAIDLEY